MRTPMPSPRGTNKAALFRGAAYDEAPDDKTMKIMTLLARKLSAEDWAALQEHLVADPAEDADLEELPDNALEDGMGGRAKAMDGAIRASTDDVGGLSYSDLNERAPRK